MATSPKRRRGAPEPQATGDGGVEGGPVVPPGTTGRFLVLFRQDDGAAGARALGQIAGLSVASTADFEGAAPTSDLGGAGALLFHGLGVAVVDAPPEQIRGLGAAEDSGILAVEPERTVYAIQDRMLGAGLAPPPDLGWQAGMPLSPIEYLRGYRDAVNHLYESLAGADEPDAEGEAEAEAARVIDEAEATWGLQATRALTSRFSGAGMRVAVLDTGFDLGHPDFAGRAVAAESFVQGQAAQDGHGHGTHCIGTSCGPRRPGTLPRYGIAWEAEIFAGKVLSNQGSGGDAGILAGIQWAMANGCPVVSMSLGAPVERGQAFSQVYETVARRALAAGTLIIAAAGNDSERPRRIAPVGHPANCPSIMAVGALDQRMRVAPFSCGGLNRSGGQVDIAGPGVAVLSSWPRPLLQRTISGTSMATPHVAGIAALFAQSDPLLRGRALMSMLTQSARRLRRAARDVGAGLVQAP